MDRFGFDEVFLETVGVGQVQYAVRQEVDTVVLVLNPDSGDVVQAMKAGISEMADIFVVNKSDLPSAQKLAKDVESVVSLLRRREKDVWEPPVLLTSSSDVESVRALSKTIDSHLAWCSSQGLREQRCLQRNRDRLKRSLEKTLIELIGDQTNEFFEQSLATQRQLAVRMLSSKLNES
jgi:LAO/AO transport system kinase